MTQRRYWHIGRIARRMAFHCKDAVWREVLERDARRSSCRFNSRQDAHTFQKPIEERDLLFLFRIFSHRERQLHREQILWPVAQIKLIQAVKTLCEQRTAKAQRYSDSDLSGHQDSQCTSA